MSMIELVDVTRPIKFYGCRVVASAHPSLVLLAEALSDPNVRRVRETVGTASVLSGEEARALVGFARGTAVGGPIRATLNEATESVQGEPLLTGGVSLQEFRAFLQAVVNSPAVASAASALLTGHYLEWAQLGANEVRFTGNRRKGLVGVSPALVRLAAAARR